MRYWFGFVALCVLTTLPVSSGCAGDDVHPVWGAMCHAICNRGDECFEIDVGACNSLCLSELGNVRCKANQPAADACVEGIGELSCMAIDDGQLPDSCDEVCLCQSVDDCDDGNQCTAGMCDVESGACTFSQVPDGVACAGEAGTCRQASCEMECTEAGIRRAVVTGGGPYVFACDGPTTVTTQGEIAISKDLILDGGDNLTVDAGGRHRVFSVSSELEPIVELHNLTISGGGETDSGGGIYNFGTLTLTGCVLSGNAARVRGGAIGNTGILTLVNTTVSENTAEGFGGGVNNRGTLTMVDSTLSENAASGGGGLTNGARATLTDCTVEQNTGDGIWNRSDLTVIGSTVSENTGSGIINEGDLTMTNSTVSANTAGLRGGGIRVSDAARRTTVISSTVSGNTAAGVWNDGTLTMRNSLINDRCGATLSRGEWVSQGGNIESPADTCGFDQSTDRVGVTAGQLNLGPLQDNGGPTLTHAPGSGSIAIDLVSEAACVDADGELLPTDQRGEERPRGPQCDAGAVEVKFDLCEGVVCDDGIDCTDDGTCNPTTGLCEGPGNEPKDTRCDQDGGQVCDGAGNCVECNHATQCDDRDECTADTCTPASSTCGHPPVPDDTGCADGAGTCQQGICIGEFACNEQGIRDAIAQGGGPHAFACVGPTTVTTDAEIVIDNDVVLDGVGNLTVDGNGTHRVLSLPPGVTAELRRFTVTRGGGPVVGAGIRNEGTLTVTDSTVTKNEADGDGGGIRNDATLTLINTNVSDNTANLAGGGISNHGPLSLTGSSVSRNTAPFNGGGILNFATLTLTNSTVSQNIGGGVDNSGTLTMTHGTISGNTDRAISGGAATVMNTVIEGNCGSPPLLTSGGGNIESPGNTCGLNQSIGDRVDVSTQALNLGPLQDNGGPTLTQLPGSGSVAINAIDEVDCAVSTDQRGVTRPQGPLCDVGAVEVEGGP
jgi:hypothetical protein